MDILLPALILVVICIVGLAALGKPPPNKPERPPLQ